MSGESSAFSVLPLSERDSLLQQAFCQLDRRHLFGVAPRVCRLWHQLSLSIITSLDVKITTEEAAEQLSLWVRNHGAGLNSVVLRLDVPGSLGPMPRTLQQSLHGAHQLRSLTLSRASTLAPAQFLVPVHQLTSLTNLSISALQPPAGILASLLRMTQMKGLQLHNVDIIEQWEPYMEQLATCLVGLSSLEFSCTSVSPAALVQLHKLPLLKQLVIEEPMTMHASSLRQLEGLPITRICMGVQQATQGDLSRWLQHTADHLHDLSICHPLHPTDPFAFLPVHEVTLHKAVHLKKLMACALQPNVAHVAALTQLTSLWLMYCGLDDTAVCKLSTLCNLQELALITHPGITGAQGSMQVLARSMPCLNFLHLGGTHAQEAAQSAFAERIVSCDLIGGSFNLRPI